MYHIDVRHGVRRYGVRDDRLAGSQLGMRSRHSVGSRQQQLRGRGAAATGATATGSGDDVHRGAGPVRPDELVLPGRRLSITAGATRRSGRPPIRF